MNVTLEQFLLGIVIVSGLLLLILAALGNAWDWFVLRKSRKMKMVCRLCGMRFYAEGKAALVECPHCDAINERS